MQPIRLPRSLVVALLVAGLVLVMAPGAAAQAPTKLVPHQQPIAEGSLRAPDAYDSFDNPDYYYAGVQVPPTGTTYRQAGLSSDGSRLVAQKSWNDGTYDRTEIVLMNADGSGELGISPGDSGEGDIYAYMNPFWSDDGTAIGFAEVHNANPNKIIRYDLATSTRTYIYEPAAPDDVANPDFVGTSKTTIVFWAYGPVGGADLFIWDGSTLSNLTNSADYKEYEPVSNADGSVILYWSGETTTEPVNTTHTLTNVGGTWTKDVGFAPIADSYWSYWSGRADNTIALTVMSSKDVHIHDSTGAFVLDLTGPGYSGGSGQWNFFGSHPKGPDGEWLITSNSGRAGAAGRDIVIAADRMNLYVDDSGSDSNPGTQAAPFATIQKGVDEVASGGTVHVADGNYAATSLTSIVIDKALSLIGASRDGTIIDAGAWGTSSVGWPRGIQVKASGVTIKNLTVQGFTGDLVDTGGYGIVFRDWDHDYPPETLIYYSGGTVENVRLQNNYSALYALVQSYLTVTNCLIQNNSSDGMFIARWSDHANITGNTVLNSGNHGIWVGKDWTGYGASGDATITGNTVNGAVEGGITFEASSTATISSNDISNVKGGGWSVGAISLKDGVSNVTVSNNVVHDNSSIGCPSDYAPCTGNGIGVDGASSNVTVSNNSIYGNTGYGLKNASAALVNASGNWWGSADPAAVKTTANGGVLVDYTPWLALGTDTGDPGFQGDFSTLWVDDDSPQTGTTGRVQEGINLVTASTVHLAAGTYSEGPQVTVSTDVAIIGADRATTIIRPTQDTGNSGDAKGWFLITGAELNLSNVTLDGSGYKVYQALRHKGSGTVDNVAFTQIKYNESGPDYAGIAAAVFDGGNVDFTNCTFGEIGRVGVLYFGTGVTGSTFSGNTYTGKGTGDWLDYALDISAGAVVAVENNTITGNQGVASIDDSTSAGILVTTYFGSGTQATITGNVLTGNTTGIDVGYDGSDSSVVVAHFNRLDGNTDYGIYSTAPMVDASANWWGSADPAAVSGMVSGPVDYTPLVESATDTSGSPGFQPDLSSLTVHTLGEQTGTSGRIQEGINLVTASTVHVKAGTYAESVEVNKSVTLIMETGVVVQPTSPCFTISADNVTLSGGICEPTSGDHGVLTGAAVNNLIISNMEIRKRTGATTGDGIHLGHDINNLRMVDNYIHGLDGDGIEYATGTTVSGVHEVQGNLFQNNVGYGVNNASANTYAVEYNSWGHLDGPLSGDGLNGLLTYDPWTHVALDMLSSGSPVPDKVAVGAQIVYTVRLDAWKVHGADFDLAFDPTTVTVVSVSDGGLFGHQAECDLSYSNTTGVVSFCGYRTDPLDGASQVLYEVTFQGVAAGVSDLNLDELSDTFGMAPPSGASNNIYAHALTDGSVTVYGAFNLTGRIDLQGRLNDSGAQLTFAAGLFQGYGPYPFTLSDAWGAISRSGVVEDTYPITVGMNRYLDVTAASLKSVAISTSKTLLSTLVLLGGDANDNDDIEIGDATIIGGVFGSSPPTDVRADINEDNRVDILDLVLMGGNYGKLSATAYAGWTP